MKILLTGATGAIGSKLVPKLLDLGHDVIAASRSPHMLAYHPNLTTMTIDLLNPKTLKALPRDIDCAYYLAHSMCDSAKTFAEKERACAQNFVDALQTTNTKQLIFLSGIANELKHTSHINSRLDVEFIFRKSQIPTTILRAGIIVGEGSASFEIIRDLVERLPVMTPPRWVHNQCQPIALDDVLEYLCKVIDQPDCLNQVFDIGGPDILSYKDLLLACAAHRKMKRRIVVVPVLTPYLASLWLLLITKVNFNLCKHLIVNMLNNFVCRDNKIDFVIPIEKTSYQQALEKAFRVTETPPEYGICKIKLENANPTQISNFFGDLWVQPDRAIFRPRGLLGRAYWHFLKPLHRARLKKGRRRTLPVS